MDNSTPDRSEKLVLYLDGLLTGSERDAMEAQLQEDPALQLEYESLLETRAAVRYYGLQQQVAGIHSGMMESFQTPVRSISRGKKILRYSMAVAAGLLVLVGAWLAYSFFSLTPDKVFAANYQTYETVNVRDGNNTAASPFENFFTAKNYQELIRLYDAGEALDARSLFICAVAAMELKDDTRAIRSFKQALQYNRDKAQTAYNDEAEYYLALSYIRNKDFDFALPLLQKIKEEPQHAYHHKVTTRLIRKVKLLKWR